MRSRLFLAAVPTPLRPVSSFSRSTPWVCASCRRKTAVRRNLATSTNTVEGKPYYVTTPIFYVNAAPHVGHLYSMVLADILKRWQILRGKKAILSTGVDEHGMKVQQAAFKAGSEPKPFTDRGAEVFKTLAARAEISNDHFVRTTDPAHKEAVQYAWYLLKERGYIYTSKHEGWYSVSDETFYPESGVQLYLDPATGRKIMISIETKKEVEWTSETNYHFKLSAFQEPLLKFYRDNPEWIVPQTRMNDVVHAVDQGLEDLSISRPTERLSWGIPVPDDETQTIYVWLDALLNYITKVGYPWPPDEAHAGGWPADCQVIGKDIVRFHCIYWPAFLLALSIPPPSRILTHAHWTLGRQKMAKSTGNVVNPFFALDRFGVDTMRYYLAHDGGISHDSDYSNYYIIERYKKGLQGGLGNLASRILRGKGWIVREAVEKMREKMLEEPPEGELEQEQWRVVESMARNVEKEMDGLDVSKALKQIMEAIYQTNKYLQTASPWHHVQPTYEDSYATPPSVTHHLTWPSTVERAIRRESDKAAPSPVDPTIYLCTEALRIAGILLQPYMPGKAGQLLDMLGVEASMRGFEFARLGKDGTYGVSKVDLGKGHRGALFPPLASEV